MEFPQNIIREVERATDTNQHTEARILIAEQLEMDGAIVEGYIDALQKIDDAHMRAGSLDRDLSNVRMEITEDLIDLVDDFYTNGDEVYNAL